MYGCNSEAGAGGNRPPLRAGRRSPSGYTLVEILVVLVITAIGLSIAVSSFGLFQARASARGAAQYFSRDLTQARAWARRSHEWVAVRFDEDAADRRYVIVAEGGDTLADRRFVSGQDIKLDSLNLSMDGDTLRFNASGVIDLSGADPSGATALAYFHAGSRTYRVRFNATGAYVVEDVP